MKTQPIVPAQNVLWFCFEPESDRRALHGTPADCMRKFQALEKNGCLNDGLEIFLLPERLKSVDEFEPWFYEKFRELEYRAVHIAGTLPNFMTEVEETGAHFDLLYQFLEKLDVQAVVLHAHHFKHDRPGIRKVLEKHLPGIKIYVENNGFDNEWGHSIEGLTEIFTDFPEFGLCFDIDHLKDFPTPSFDEFVSTPIIRERICQIHYSYSTHLLPEDPYIAAGFPGYGPFHALWSVLGIEPSERTIKFLRQYPIVLEGVQPKEDPDFNFLKEEIKILQKYD